ncbi:multiheme c-type cytochrome [Flavisericum labens]|uniref:multiheme c-type cytochrome n=1 Tax=Flavisericum labens TaxID=3377112 RepID=UPI00387B1C96
MKIVYKFHCFFLHGTNRLILLVFFLGLSCNKTKDYYEPIIPLAIHHNGMEYIGMESCVKCHKDIVENHKNTSHYNTSAVASSKSIKGSFSDGENILGINHQTAFKMLISDTAFVQQLYLKESNEILYTAPMQMVIGSGTKGQSFLVWDRDALYQLQVSYFTPTDNWINSPGFPPKPVQVRPVPGRCLECHTTFAKRTDRYYDNRFDKKTLIYGIDCQRCHGDVKRHTLHHLEHPKDTIAKYILSFKDLNQSQQLDACALCHSGIREKQIKDNFEFMLGDNLDKFSLPDYDESSLYDLDVHGNQYGLLQASACFKRSEKMSCSTCHNPHKSNRGNANFFNDACVTCHGKDKVHNIAENALAKEFSNCISCHMPLTESNVMKIQVEADSLVAVKVRTHLIGIYDDINN